MKIKLNRDIFEQCISMVESGFKKKYSEEEKFVYYEVLKDIEEEEFKKATINLIKTHPVMTLPIPNDFVKRTESKENKVKKKYIEIKEEIKKLINRHGLVIYEDPLIHVVVNKLGGLERLRMMESYYFEKVMNEELENIVSLYYDNYSPEDIKVPLGRTEYLDEELIISFVGNKDKINKWLNYYSSKIEVKESLGLKTAKMILEIEEKLKLEEKRRVNERQRNNIKEQ